ncbi:hypothetical protein NOGI109294_03155 [Nocardiopsis gilva]|nr:hypothetical protein [Nocardiopsis gilva]
MTAVFVELQPPAQRTAEIEFVDDLDDVLESEKCSCNAGDDNPY